MLPEKGALMRPIPLLWLVLTLAVPSPAQLGAILKTAENAVQSNNTDISGLSTDKITAGLKEALQVSTRNAVSSTGKPDGFFKNAAIKILLPDKLATIGK